MGVTNFPNGVNIGDSAGGTSDFTIANVTVTKTAAQINALAGGTASGLRIAGGVQSVTGAGTINTNLTTVTSVTATLETSGTAAGTACVVTAGTAGGGSIYLRTWNGAAFTTAGTVAQNVNWQAFGT